MNTTTEPTKTIEAVRVIGDDKGDVLTRHFGRYMLRFEDMVYACMRRLAVQYCGGVWHAYELSNGGFFMAPEDSVPVEIRAPNGYEGHMSAEAAGILSCLFALTHLSMQLRSEVFTRHFYQLRDFALEHTDAQQILAAMR